MYRGGMGQTPRRNRRQSRRHGRAASQYGHAGLVGRSFVLPHARHIEIQECIVMSIEDERPGCSHIEVLSSHSALTAFSSVVPARRIVSFATSIISGKNARMTRVCADIRPSLVGFGSAPVGNLSESAVGYRWAAQQSRLRIGPKSGGISLDRSSVAEYSSRKPTKGRSCIRSPS